MVFGMILFPVEFFSAIFGLVLGYRLLIAVLFLVIYAMILSVLRPFSCV
jgi:hypothetical protein